MTNVSVRRSPFMERGNDLDVQDPRSGAYWFIVCRRCRLTWYLPKDEHKRTKDALAILRAHAQEHRP
jgi:hypothetical protein